MAERQPTPIEELLTAQVSQSTEMVAFLIVNLGVASTAIAEAVKAMQSGRTKHAEQILLQAAQRLAATRLPGRAEENRR
jgi:hypothetical protein